MKPPREPAREAAESRDLARRARRLALMLSDPNDQDRINRYAQELEQRASELATEAAGRPVPPAQPVTQQQQQVQAAAIRRVGWR
jgi:hypothetical protein